MKNTTNNNIGEQSPLEEDSTGKTGRFFSSPSVFRARLVGQRPGNMRPR